MTNPTSNAPWPRVAVIGAGAVGCYFGGKLFRAGCPVTFIGRPGPQSSLAKISRDGLYFEGLEFQETLRVETSSDAGGTPRSSDRRASGVGRGGAGVATSPIGDSGGEGLGGDS